MYKIKKGLQAACKIDLNIEKSIFIKKNLVKCLNHLKHQAQKKKGKSEL